MCVLMLRAAEAAVLSAGLSMQEYAILEALLTYRKTKASPR